jgi:15-cis-phytoene synthase
MRPPLLGIYALLAEWHALMDPATAASAAHLKLAWWVQEMQRLQRGTGIHPVSRFLTALPNAAAVDFSPLIVAAEYAVTQIGGAPLEFASDLEPLSRKLWGDPLMVAARLAAPLSQEAALQECTTALAAAGYLARAVHSCGRDARFGRIPFAIDELLAAGIENADLTAVTPPPRLQCYLDAVRERAKRYFEHAAAALPRAQRFEHRHLLILAALGAQRLSRGGRRTERRRARDMLLAWTTARRARR